MNNWRCNRQYLYRSFQRCVVLPTERNERKANPDLIDKLSKIFKADKKELHISFVSDKVVYELLDEESSIDILKVAEEKISYIIQSKKKPNAK